MRRHPAALRLAGADRSAGRIKTGRFAPCQSQDSEFLTLLSLLLRLLTLYPLFLSANPPRIAPAQDMTQCFGGPACK